MLVARQERTLAIDGVYIHVSSCSTCFIFVSWWIELEQVMPSTNKAKAVFDSGKTLNSRGQKQTLWFRSRQSKIRRWVVFRPVFCKSRLVTTAEIVQIIKNLKVAFERSGTVDKSRRSRHFDLTLEVAYSSTRIMFRTIFAIL